MKRIQFTPVNVPVVIIVAILCALSMTLFFLQRQHREEPVVDVADSAEQEEPFDELAYYNQLAGEYLSALPMDKRVVATLIDSVNHCIVYYETSSHPSCYSYDLESLTTMVLFGGENGFYVGTKLLIVGSIQEWRRIGDRVVFVASNRAPGVEYPEKTLVFSMNLYSHQLAFLYCVAEAGFVDDTHLSVVTARFLFRNFLTREPVYNQTEKTLELSFED